jgi:RNA polymerase sigma-70 factor (ECF subfamily)
VWSVVARVTNGAADVEDIVHATFLKLPELAPAYDGRPSSKSWLCGIAVRLALRRGRSLRRFARIVARFGEIMRHYSALDPEVEAADREDLARVERAVAALPESKRAVLVLVEVEGMSQADVATALGIPVATVRTRLFGARQALRAAVGRKTEGTHGL